MYVGIRVGFILTLHSYTYLSSSLTPLSSSTYNRSTFSTLPLTVELNAGIL